MSSASNTQSGAPALGIAVFGSADSEPGSELYERARSVGIEIARLGAAVITGGYGGVMEAASAGAREIGAEAIGVTCASFRGRQANACLTLEIEELDLFERTRRMFALSRGFVILGGGAGTLAELAFLWARARSGSLEGRIVLFDEFWGTLVDELKNAGRFDFRCQNATRSADTPRLAARLALGYDA